MSRLARWKVAVPALLALLPAVFSAGCGGGSSPGTIGGGAFLLLSTEPANNGRLFLNQSVRLAFSNPVDLTTANFNSVAFFVFDPNGNAVSEQVVGTFRHGKLEDTGEDDPRILEFVPRLPGNDTYSDGGFKPSRIYLVSLIGASSKAAPTLRDTAGHTVSENSPVLSFSFKTASGTTPQELFLDTRIGGPRVTSIQVDPKVSGDRVSVNQLGGVPVSATLRFNQPLNPSSKNVPLRQDLNPVNADLRSKGRIFLEYDDTELGKRRWIPTDVEMPENDSTGATVVLRPDALLPTSAEVRIVVEAELEDISGESNTKDASYQRVVGSFRVEDQFNAQFDAVVVDFESADLMDPEAAFRDPPAELTDGVLRASFDFEGIITPFDYEPQTKEIVLSTDFATVQPKNGPPLNVAGGVFNFHDIVIPDGITVRGIGTNPMVWLATGLVRVDGHMNVDGGEGDQVNTLNSANFPTAGGQGVCTGGNGGKASHIVTANTPQGEFGYGPFQRAKQGGEGGRIACGATGTQAGSGGGGGGHATKGDPDYYNITKAPENGIGGNGNDNRGTVAGGQPGPLVFIDQDTANNFYGRQITSTGEVKNGELSAPIGGAGGGGGGDRTVGNPPNDPCNTPNWINDNKGGGGGGGAGVIVIKALGRITVGPKGKITANGGRGGGGEDAGSSRQGGGGGGGSGGMVILMSATGIDLYQHAQTWATGDYNFSVSADGAIGRNTSFGNPARLEKYPSTTGAPNGGGFGGMGVVQLMVPPGSSTTPEDDNIRVLDSAGNPVNDTIKTQYLVRGDIRPNPVLMPTPFSRFSQGRTRWVATGASVRRVVPSTADPVRATISKPVHETDAKNYGPDYFFAGLQTTGVTTGYVAHDESGLYKPTVVKDGTVIRAESKATTYRAIPVHVIAVSGNVFPADGSYANYQARLLDGANNKLEPDFRIVGHTQSELYLDATSADLLPAGIVKVQVLAKFFEIYTDGNEGLGRTYGPKPFYPIANAQVGFAFHKDPSQPNITGNNDANRFPTQLGTFLFDLESSDSKSAREQLRKLHYPFAQVMVRFNLDYNYKNPDEPGENPVGPASSKPEVRFVLLPYVY